MSDKPTLRIFLSSPGDVAEERALAQQVFQRLAKEFAGSVELRISVWEYEPLYAHAGFQEQIDRPSECDLVVCILWSRLGSRLAPEFAAQPGETPPTGAQFEIEDALESFRRRGRPNLLIYRKTARPKVDLDSADAEERLRQFRDLDAFCQRTFYDAQGVARVAHHLFADGFEFERRLREHVGKWLERQLQASGTMPDRRRWVHGSPFRGLQAFSEEYQDVFFGRSQALGELIQRIAAVEIAAQPGESRSRLLLIQGMSGSGKTSLVCAGLLPLLRHRPIEGIATWFSLSLRPSDIDGAQPDAGPLGALAARLRTALPAVERVGVSSGRLATELRAHPVAAAARLETYLAAEAAARGLSPAQLRLVVYLDQLEEAFSALTPPEAEVLFAAVVELAGLAGVWVVATIRSDLVHRLESYPALIERLRRTAPYLMIPPRGDELAEMIRGPADAAGLMFEVRNGVSLDQALLQEAEGRPESLPLLEYALEQLYARREGDTLKWDVYQPAQGQGGLRGALVAVAETTVEGAGAAVDAPYRRVMRELTAVGEDGTATRRYAPRGAFAAGSPERALLDRLIEARLCVTDVRGTEPVVYLAHEALLQSWPRAGVWLQQEAALLRLRDELLGEARAWSKHGENDNWLGTAPEKLASISQLETADMLPSGVGAQYALRSRRRARRNRLVRQGAVAAIAGLAVVAIIAGLIAARQRDRAQQQALTADQVSSFMVSLFELADPGENQGNTVTVRQVLDRGAAAASAQLESQPGVRASLLTAMGQAYSGLGLYPQAIKLLDQARADVAAGASTPAERVRTLLAAGNAFNRAADYEHAQAMYAHAVDLARRTLERGDPLRSNALTGLADVLTQSEHPDLKQAEALCNEALAADRKRSPADPLTLAQTLSTLATVHYFNHDLPAAERMFRESFQLRERVRGRRDAQSVEALNNLGAAIYDQGRYAEAADIWRQALPLYREVFGPDHPEVTIDLNNLGRSLLMAGQVSQAVPYFQQAITIDERTKAPDHDDLIAPLNSLGMAALYLGKPSDALLSLARAEQIARARHHAMLYQVLINVADAQLQLGQADNALANLKEAHVLLVSQYPLGPTPDKSPNAWRYAVWDSVNAGALARSGNAAAARAALQKARAVLAQRFGASGYYPQRTQQRLAALGAT